MITVTSGPAPVSVPDDNVYFTFGSGRLQYDCVSCNSQCCRGHGYTLSKGPELDAQLETAPAVRFFVGSCDRGTKHYHVTNCAPACFFLQQDGLCKIQRLNGYEAKPGTCRLFPFNNLRYVGPYLVVLPHTELCPLEVASPEEASELSNHAALLASMSMAGVDTHVAHADLEGRDPHIAIALERRVVSLAEADAGSSDFIAFVAAQSEAQSASTNVEGATSDRFRRFISLIHAVLGVEPGEVTPDSATTRTLIAITPIVRARLLFRLPTAPVAPFPLPLPVLPMFLVAFHEVLLLARAAGTPITFQGAMRLLDELSSYLRMLALMDEVLVVRPDVVLDGSWSGDAVGQTAYAGIVKALLRPSQLKNPKSLGQILTDHMAARGLERSLFVRRLAARLSGKLMPVGEEVSLKDRMRHPKSAVQQWVWALMPSEQIVAATAWRAKRST